MFAFWADRIATMIGGEWAEKVDGLDESYWDLKVGEAIITIHRQHFLGVCAFCVDTEAGRQLIERIKKIGLMPPSITKR
jgi:hypothetical protein